MAVYKYPLIAKEGWPLIAGLAVVAIVVQYFSSGLWEILSLFLWLPVVAAIVYFRDPPRHIPPRPLGVISPVDGTVTGIETVADPYVERQALRVCFHSGVFSVHSVHSPIEGKIQNQWFVAKQKNTHGRRRYAMWIQTDEADDVVIEMCPPAAMPPVCDVQAGERIGQGARCGFTYLGAEFCLYLPEGSRIEVKDGDHVSAGSDIIATLVHRMTG